MSDSLIKVENIGKKYIIGHQKQEHYTALRDVISEGFKSFGRKLLSPMSEVIENKDEFEEFWALKDVSFEVKQGDRVGIIGRNGAGKSTLLKILSRITEPTEGRISIKGRVASLLEVGTGFHPELSGRENIFLNGAILGMSKVEIKKKFDEIVAFAEVEKFIDTPVKRYSSGMYVRLAFAVAAHLEPEILIVDEVLAVGDAAFQKKCLGKMEDVSKKEGRTILFVSHNLQAIGNLCSRIILIESGTVKENTQTEQGIRVYLNSLRNFKNYTNANLRDRLKRASGDARFISVIVENAKNEEQWNFKVGETIRIKAEYKVFNPIASLGIYIALRSNMTGEVLTNCKHIVSENALPVDKMGEVTVEIPQPNIRPGDYLLYLWLGNIEFNYSFDVIDDNIELPYLSVDYDDPDPHQQIGYFSIESKLISV